MSQNSPESGRFRPFPGIASGAGPIDGVEGRVPAEGRLTEGRLGAEGLLTDGLLIEGERLTEGRAPPPPRPPRWANEPSATSATLNTAAVEIKAYFFIVIPPLA